MLTLLRRLFRRRPVFLYHMTHQGNEGYGVRCRPCGRSLAESLGWKDAERVRREHAAGHASRPPG